MPIYINGERLSTGKFPQWEKKINSGIDELKRHFPTLPVSTEWAKNQLKISTLVTKDKAPGKPSPPAGRTVGMKCKVELNGDSYDIRYAEKDFPNEKAEFKKVFVQENGEYCLNYKDHDRISIENYDMLWYFVCCSPVLDPSSVSYIDQTVKVNYTGKHREYVFRIVNRVQESKSTLYKDYEKIEALYLLQKDSSAITDQMWKSVAKTMGIQNVESILEIKTVRALIKNYLEASESTNPGCWHNMLSMLDNDKVTKIRALVSDAKEFKVVTQNESKDWMLCNENGEETTLIVRHKQFVSALDNIVNVLTENDIVSRQISDEVDKRREGVKTMDFIPSGTSAKSVMEGIDTDDFNNNVTLVKHLVDLKIIANVKNGWWNLDDEGKETTKLHQCNWVLLKDFDEESKYVKVLALWLCKNPSEVKRLRELKNARLGKS